MWTLTVRCSVVDLGHNKMHRWSVEAIFLLRCMCTLQERESLSGGTRGQWAGVSYALSAGRLPRAEVFLKVVTEFFRSRQNVPQIRLLKCVQGADNFINLTWITYLLGIILAKQALWDWFGKASCDSGFSLWMKKKSLFCVENSLFVTNRFYWLKNCKLKCTTWWLSVISFCMSPPSLRYHIISVNSHLLGI